MAVRLSDGQAISGMMRSTMDIADRCENWQAQARTLCRAILVIDQLGCAIRQIGDRINLLSVAAVANARGDKEGAADIGMMAAQLRDLAAAFAWHTQEMAASIDDVENLFATDDAGEPEPAW